MLDTTALSQMLQTALERDLSNCKGLSYSQQWAAEVLRKTLLKKFLKEDGVTTPLQDAEALRRFMAANKKATMWKWHQTSELDARIDRRIRDYLHRWIGTEFFLTDHYEKYYDVGPGASRHSDFNDLYSKLYESAFSATSGYLYTLYHRSIASRTAEAAEYRRNEMSGRYKLVDGSSLSFVPKQSDVSRVICTEPLLNMMAQKAIGGYLESVLAKHCSIDLATQPDINRQFAKTGSIYGSHATIDLSSASDSISMELVRVFFPPLFVKAIERTRSRFTTLPDGRKVRLGMVSSMGNGFTFPLETILFYAISRAASDEVGCGRCMSFGDDIIVETEAYALTAATLERLGFTLNHDKSFSEGPFRESCGEDYLFGTNVRGVYLRSLARDTDRISAFNRLRIWSNLHSIPLFRTLLCLRRSLSNAFYGCHTIDSSLYASRAQVLRYGQNCYSTLDGVLYTQSYRISTATESAPLRNWQGALLAMSSGRVRSVAGQELGRGLKKPTTRLRKCFAPHGASPRGWLPREPGLLPEEAMQLLDRNLALKQDPA